MYSEQENYQKECFCCNTVQAKYSRRKKRSKQYQPVERKYKEINPFEHTCRMNKQHGGQNNMENRTGTRKHQLLVQPTVQKVLKFRTEQSLQPELYNREKWNIVIAFIFLSCKKQKTDNRGVDCSNLSSFPQETVRTGWEARSGVSWWKMCVGCGVMELWCREGVDMTRCHLT